ncbi:hypothetical protein AcdelDRAFT_1974 [Acidovorax delafieldii 2AN]|uniref:Uncharacterized protein n=1 Tax=Acidovorax delafieldii 2AN TaxID=573060 RepID=C5T4Z4_ACIDE|nr:hypothetical protein [Acidovorax delafieldii]EER60449.1 hypothetical protein AcdelDRAFT_1974 [Acidovorax delafieldii 2AN]
MTEPTDIELRSWVQSFIEADDGVRTNDERDHMNFARAALEKWGQPAEAGEPEGWITWWPTAPGVHKPVYSHGPNKPSHGPALDSRLRKYPVFTPQPTQAQAGAVPLTVSQIRKWWESDNGMEDCDMCRLTDFLRVVRAVEERHGIKGGQHGAE